MPLDDSCEKYKGALIFVLPTIGFGWARMSPGAPSGQPGTGIEPPAPFYARVIEFHYVHSQIKAGVGIIEEQGHPLNTQWMAFCLRDRGEDVYDLISNPGKYNVTIGNTKPSINIESEQLAMPQWMQYETSPHLSGLGYIVESATSLEEIYERIRKARNSPNTTD